ncbi:MAG: exodeoxyribonuclease III [Acidobacteria bacterium]|nr:exodeoxyribonuclease III [Acidobacteriota bacterium]
MFINNYNVNSIRKRLHIVLEWLSRHRPDILCLQETKVQDQEFPVGAFKDAGYYVYFRGMKGYNGVATISLRQADTVVYGFEEGPDIEDARLLQTVINGSTILNTYIPQGYRINSDKYQFKLKWFARFRRYLEKNLNPAKPVVWLGDLNVAPEPIDVYHPDRRVNDVDFHIDARNAYKNVVSWGFVDVFRKLHPDRVQYTYWDYFRNAFENNWGWRIDHILATYPLANCCAAADVDLEPRKAPSASDHTVAWAEFTLSDTRSGRLPLSAGGVKIES